MSADSSEIFAPGFVERLSVVDLHSEALHHHRRGGDGVCGTHDHHDGVGGDVVPVAAHAPWSERRTDGGSFTPL